jgi:molybdopterin-guanine dinucleotide biosynthesis protein B
LRKAIAFTGLSNSGKTTLIEKVALKLLENYKVAIVKHDPKDKAIFDTIGKDSHKFSSTGAEVAVVSPTRTTYFSQKTSTIEELIEMFGDFDFLLVEGLKTLPLPRICVVRDTIDDSYIDKCSTIASDGSVDISGYDATILPLNDIDTITQWIINNAKEV